MHVLHVCRFILEPPLFFVFETKSLKSFSFIFLLSYLSFLAFDVVSRSRGKPPFSFSFSFSFSFLFFSPIFPVFFFFCDEENKRRERLYKSAYFPAPSSCERFMRCARASARFPAPLSRARSPVNARAWRGQGSDDVSSSRAKLVFV